MTEPVPSYGGLTWWGNFQEFGFLTKLRAEQLRDIGASLSPHSAFLLLQGVETLPQRMEAHVANARAVARVAGTPTRACPTCAGPGCPTTRTTSAPRATCRSGPGAVFAFGVRGGREARASASSSRCSSAATSPTSATPARW